MNNIKSNNKKPCAGKDCQNQAKTFLKIRYIHRVGQFCDNCTLNLKRDGIAEEEGINDYGQYS
jgi:hypothetical protein